MTVPAVPSAYLPVRSFLGAVRAMLAMLCLLGCAVGLIASAGAAQADTFTGWTQITPPGPFTPMPTPRSEAAMAYGPGAQSVVLFGGETLPGPLGDTWTWNGVVWTQQHPSDSPPAQSGASMTYDYASRQLILFGTGGDGTSPETWTWDGTTWAQLHPPASPPARLNASMAYDFAGGRILLFGGRRPFVDPTGSTGAELGDTWAWDGSTWTQLVTTASPSPRWGAAAAYDPQGGVQSPIVLFGGADSTGQNFGDTWGWNGNNWVQQHPTTHPSARFGASMIFDEDSRRVVLIGGYEGTEARHVTWTWNGFTNNWTELGLPDPLPAPRAFASMAYDFDTRQLILFGGGSDTHPPFNDTWVYGDPQAAQWIGFSSTPPSPAVVGGSYLVTASGGGSGNPVVFSVDATSDGGVCTATVGGLVTFTGPGTCVIDADQGGAQWFSAAPQARQTITVVPAPPADTTPPVLAGMPGDIGAAATAPVGAVVGYAAPTAADNVDGAVPVTCTPASGSTFPLGVTNVTCTATDVAGNTASGTFRVTVAYRWDGFLQPVNDTAHTIGTALSVFKAGSTVPLKFQLKLADGTAVQGSASPMFLTPEKGAATSAAVDETQYSDPGTSGIAFTYDPTSRQFQYNFKTTKAMAGYWWRVSVLLPDGSKRYVTVGLT